MPKRPRVSGGVGPYSVGSGGVVALQVRGSCRPERERARARQIKDRDSNREKRAREREIRGKGRQVETDR